MRRMKNGSLFRVLAVAGTMVIFTGSAWSAGPMETPSASSVKLESLTPQQARDVEAILRTLLKRHPEVITEALEEMAAREKLAEGEKEKSAVKTLQVEIAKGLNAPVLGNPKGDVTIVEFFDYNCPYCRQVAANLMRTVQSDGKIRLILLEFPILGAPSVLAAKAALAADIQGKYSEMHAALMAAETRHDEASIMAVATRLGLDTKKLKTDMETKPVLERLAIAFRHAEGLGLQGTPAFLIGDALYPGALPAAKLTEFIATARKPK